MQISQNSLEVVSVSSDSQNNPGVLMDLCFISWISSEDYKNLPLTNS